VLELVSIQLFGSCLSVALEAFSARLEAHKWVAMPGPMFKQQAAAAAAQQQQQRSDGGGGGGEPPAGGEAGGAGGGAAPDDLSPPYALMEHLPLAVLTNGVLSSLNELRHCAPAPLRRPMAALLQAALERAAGALAHYRATRPLGAGELALFKAAAAAHGEVVVPYLTACFARMFGGAAPDGGGGVGAAAAPNVDPTGIKALLQDALDDGAHMPAARA
jgi:hypothetical protein